MTKYLAFDIEVAAILPDNASDWKAYRPLGITCAAIAQQMDDGSIFTDTWHAGEYDGSYTPRMAQYECRLIVYSLMAATSNGFTLLTHNGVGFDFDILAEESGMWQECAELAMNSVDTMLHFHCRQGYAVGLEAICKGMGIKGKLEGVSGALAPQMWQEGRYDEVLAYVAQDARCTLEMALAVEERHTLTWITQRGKPRTIIMPTWLPVREALKLPEPDNSWMSDPIPRSRFTEWMHKSPA